jgi:UPF0755 protein
MGLGLVLVSGLLFWSLSPASQGEGPVVVQLAKSDRDHLVERLVEAGLLEQPRIFRLYVAVFLPRVEFDAGEHLLRRGLSARELSARLGRLPSRSRARVVVPEGWHRKKIAQRLDRAEVCGAEAFLAATQEPELLERLGVQGETAEGYLFPATYDFGHNARPQEVVARMVKETRRRLEPLLKKHPEGLESLRTVYGFGERELLTLASIVERETGQGRERPLIASVFLNRLARPEADTRGRLQSDPTAAYGCEYEPDRAPSCAAYSGTVAPSMLRDPENRFNTYRHPGLPPGPIASPGLLAVEAVLAPARTDYLFFVADGSGNHTFSVTFEEHQSAVTRLREVRGRATTAERE